MQWSLISDKTSFYINKGHSDSFTLTEEQTILPFTDRNWFSFELGRHSVLALSGIQHSFLPICYAGHQTYIQIYGYVTIKHMLGLNPEQQWPTCKL